MDFLRRNNLVILMIGLIILFQSCMNKEQLISPIEKIDLYKSYQNRGEVPVSNIASDIEYIRLETGEECMLNDPHLVNVKDSMILFIGFRKLYVFSRHTGKFLYEISAYGRGPDEYSHTTNIYDEDKDLFFVSYNFNKRDQNNFPIYYAHDFTGEIVKSVSKPILFNQEGDELPISRFWPLNDSIYIGYVNNMSGDLPERIVLFDQDGKLLKSYPNYNTYKKEETRSFVISLNKGKFFNAGDTVRFYEEHTDTIFNINYH
jgi:hypothetical protein